ncbi:HD family phosphohydrolase, partial [Candidatus Auribacterota bacterium]
YSMGVFLFVWVIFIIVINYLKSFQPKIYGSNSKLLLISILSLVILLIAKLISFIPLNPEQAWAQYFNPIPLYAFLMAILLNRKIAFFSMSINSIFIGMLNGNSLTITIVGMIGGAIAIFSASSTRKRTQIFRAGFYMIGGSVFTIISLGIMDNISFKIYLFQSFGGMLSGFLAAMGTISLLPVLEYVFKITTDITLLELSDFNHPLLKRLVIEAPGTYHHSLMVGNLAEAAAEEIGANALLARVASYFHDVGKLSKPQYFVENAWNEKSRHEDLIPSMSSLIIIAHVKDGIDLAKKYKLNKEIIDAILEHHGTSLVYFFYKRATEEQKEDDPKVSEEHYRYPGPKPQTKETAIISLADSVEAASRTLDKPTPSRIENLVKYVINDKISKNQLDECDLTMKDLYKITARFCRILNATFHARVKYPEEEKKKQGPLNGNTDKQPTKIS